MRRSHGMQVLAAAGGGGLLGAGIGGLGVGVLVALPFGPLGLVMALPAFGLGVPLALLHAMVLGVPLYLAVERLAGPPGWAGAGLAGLLIGGVPVSILILADADGPIPWEAGMPVLIFALSGAASGLLFRRLLRAAESAGAAA